MVPSLLIQDRTKYGIQYRDQMSLKKGRKWQCICLRRVIFTTRLPDNEGSYELIVGRSALSASFWATVNDIIKHKFRNQQVFESPNRKGETSFESFSLWDSIGLLLGTMRPSTKMVLANKWALRPHLSKRALTIYKAKLLSSELLGVNLVPHALSNPAYFFL